MSIREEFEKLVKEANRKLQVQNQLKDAAQLQALEELKKRQELVMNMLKQGKSQPNLNTGLNK